MIISKGKCPFGHTDSGLGDLGDSLNEETYKKLKKVMSQITQFYENGYLKLNLSFLFLFRRFLLSGTNLKKGHYDQVCEELSRLSLDIDMCQKQISALVI